MPSSLPPPFPASFSGMRRIVLPQDAEDLVKEIIETWDITLEECPEMKIHHLGSDHDFTTLVINGGIIKNAVLEDECFGYDYDNQPDFDDHTWMLVGIAVQRHYLLALPDRWADFSASLASHLNVSATA